MNRTEKNMQTKRKIIDNALIEFGEKSYGEASLNTVCTTGNISKGIIYHYFKDKDELYLVCVKECFDALTEFLENENFIFTNPEEHINSYLAARFRFFSEHTNYSNIFFNAVLQPPIHLRKQIKALRKKFDVQSAKFYKTTLKRITLRDNISEDEAIEYFLIFQEMFNSYFQSKVNKSTDFHSLVEAHEMKLSKLLNIIFYGITKESVFKEEEL